MMPYFYRILRLTAIPLVIAGFLTLFSGFTTTKYFVIPGIGYSFSYFIHTIIFPLVFMPLFFLHSLAGTLIILNRHKSVNRKPVKVGIVLLWLTVLGAFLYFYGAQSPSSGLMNGLNGTLPGNTGNILSLDAIGKHNTASDCWIIINGKVYDVTNYLASHPGGAERITPYCGKDATQAYGTKGGEGNPHSGLADSSLPQLLIGNVGEAMSPPAQVPGGSVPQPSPPATPPAQTPSNTVTLSLSEIEKHNTASDCWIIINGKVYDVTSHLQAHPAGAGSITPYCGQDATTAYDTKGGRGSTHSSFADSTLTPILLGNVGDSVSGSQIQQVQNQTTPNLGEHEDEWEDD